MDNYQGNAVINYCEREIPYTRIIEHKHFEFGKQSHTVVTREYPADFTPGDEPYYPVNDEKNMRLYEKYKEMATAAPDVLVGVWLNMPILIWMTQLLRQCFWHRMNFKILKYDLLSIKEL